MSSVLISVVAVVASLSIWKERVDSALDDRFERVHHNLQAPVLISLDSIESQLDAIRTLLEVSTSDVPSDSLRRFPSGQ